jgi:hypothetical protein
MGWAIFFIVTAATAGVLHLEDVAVAAGLFALALIWRPIADFIGGSWKRRLGI